MKLVVLCDAPSAYWPLDDPAGADVARDLGPHGLPLTYMRRRAK